MDPGTNDASEGFRLMRIRRRRPQRSNRKNRRLHLEALESRMMLAASDLIPLSGDWDGIGATSVGLYDSQAGEFYLRQQNTPGFPTAAFKFGSQNATSLPVVGDWDGNGTETIGLYDPLTGAFSLRNSNREGAADITFNVSPVIAGAQPIAGDWNGDGRDTVGLYDPANGTIYLKLDHQSGLPDQVFSFWPSSSLRAAIPGATLTTGWSAISGDWNGDGQDGLGLYNSESGFFYVKSDLNSSAMDIVAFGPANNAARAVAGDWDGDRDDSIGYYDVVGGTFTVKNSLNSGVADTVGYVVPSMNKVAAVPTFNTVAPFDPPQLMPVASIPAGDNAGSRGVPAADNPWHNAASANDVDGSGLVTVLDVFQLIGELRVGGTRTLPATAPSDNRLFVDVNNDFQLSALDVFVVIGTLRSGITTSGQTTQNQAAGESAVTFVNTLDLPTGEGGAGTIITAPEVDTLLRRASAASSTKDAIIAIVDRGGRILGVRVEQDVLDLYDSVGNGGNGNGMIDPGSSEEAKLVFAIDGAVAKARTAAFFANGDGNGEVGPLTSRTIRFISQSTITQREVESNPSIQDPNSTIRGPGFVAPIGLGGHFPPGVKFTPPVDLFAIEHQSRDSIVHPGFDSIKGTADDDLLPTRFNVPPAFVPMDKTIEPPESYGFTSKRMVNAQSRGIATLPGGLPIYKPSVKNRLPVLVGGIGVFFPGPNGYATFEQGFTPAGPVPRPEDVFRLEAQRLNAPKVLESEWIAFAALGGSSGAARQIGTDTTVGTLGGIPRLPQFDLPFGRIDLVGITLEVYGPHPTAQRPQQGIATLLQVGAGVGQGAVSGANQVVDPGPDMDPTMTADNILFREGKSVPDGWLVLPHDSVNPAPADGGLTAAEVERIVNQGIAEANLVRAAIRLQLPGGTPGARTGMIFSVADKDGNVLGLFRMPDATIFSIDVSVAKARNTAYHADPDAILDIDRIDDNGDGTPDANVPAGTALTNRTYRFLAEPRFPAGIDGTRPGAFSSLLDVGINPLTAENTGPALPASMYSRPRIAGVDPGASVLLFDAFNPGRNFRDPGDPVNEARNQNGIVFFPGSTPLYKDKPVVGGKIIVGGFGVSGDGVDQDDVVTFAGSAGFQTPAHLRADQFFVRGVRLPFQKFLRNPHA